MLEFYEADPLPLQCWYCVVAGREECDECDYLCLRFPLTEESQRHLSRKIEERQRLAKLKREQAKRERMERNKKR